MKNFRKPWVSAVVLSAVFFLANSPAFAGESFTQTGNWVSRSACFAGRFLGVCNSLDVQRQGPGLYRLGVSRVYTGPGGLFKLASKFIDDFQVAEFGKVRVKLSLKFI